MCYEFHARLLLHKIYPVVAFLLVANGEAEVTVCMNWPRGIDIYISTFIEGKGVLSIISSLNM